MSEIQIKGVWKEFGAQVVLENLNLKLCGHEFVTIVGPSGCGKTTFLKMLLGIEAPTRGQILLDGTPLAAEPGPDRGIVFQQHALFPHLTVLGNVLLGLELAAAPRLGYLLGAPRRAARARAEEMLEAVGLAAARDKYPAQLSGGMQQRLAIAQSIVREPKVLLLDEPFASLDPGITQDMHQLIVRLWRTTRMTVFMITHDVREAFALGTRLLVFDRLRNDPQSPEAYGATITYQIPLKGPPPAKSPELMPWRSAGRLDSPAISRMPS